MRGKPRQPRLVTHEIAVAVGQADHQLLVVFGQHLGAADALEDRRATPAVLFQRVAFVVEPDPVQQPRMTGEVLRRVLRRIAGTGGQPD